MPPCAFVRTNNELAVVKFRRLHGGQGQERAKRIGFAENNSARRQEKFLSFVGAGCGARIEFAARAKATDWGSITWGSITAASASDGVSSSGPTGSGLAAAVAQSDRSAMKTADSFINQTPHNCAEQRRKRWQVPCAQ
jgi:hypothetical protein